MFSIHLNATLWKSQKLVPAKHKKSQIRKNKLQQKFRATRYIVRITLMIAWLGWPHRFSCLTVWRGNSRLDDCDSNINYCTLITFWRPSMTGIERYQLVNRIISLIELTKNLFLLAGVKIFHDFLKSQYSEENLLFWLAVEKLKKETDQGTFKELAQSIYRDYLSAESPKEVSSMKSTLCTITSKCLQVREEIYRKQILSSLNRRAI